MIVKTAGGSGFCMGVQRAMNLALAAAKAKGHIYSFGPLIHNPQEITRLADKIVPVENSRTSRYRYYSFSWCSASFFNRCPKPWLGYHRWHLSFR